MVGLQQGFRKAVGVSPMTYLSELRLERAHDQLARRRARIGHRDRGCRTMGLHPPGSVRARLPGDVPRLSVGYPPLRRRGVDQS
jgi:hypothetical protein